MMLLPSSSMLLFVYMAQTKKCGFCKILPWLSASSLSLVYRRRPYTTTTTKFMLSEKLKSMYMQGRTKTLVADKKCSFRLAANSLSWCLLILQWLNDVFYGSCWCLMLTVFSAFLKNAEVQIKIPWAIRCLYKTQIFQVTKGKSNKFNIK